MDTTVDREGGERHSLDTLIDPGKKRQRDGALQYSR